MLTDSQSGSYAQDIYLRRIPAHKWHTGFLEARFWIAFVFKLAVNMRPLLSAASRAM